MRYLHSIAATTFGLLIGGSLAHAQMQAPGSLTPRISQVLPMGGQAGSTFELLVTGQDISDVEGLHFSFPGVTAVPLSSETAPVDKKAKAKAAPALKAHKFKVTLPANAPLGVQDVRIITKTGISNPRAFVIGDHKEQLELEPNDDVPKAQRIELNSSVNGGIGVPTDVDYYVFTGKKGQRVVCSCLTSSIDSRLPVAIQVYGADDAFLGENRNFRSSDNNDAMVDVTLPADGDYYVRVFCFTYTQGGVDFFYRLSVSTAPWIDAVFPSVVEPGKDTQVTVYGRNLPGGQLDPKVVVNQRVLEKAVFTVKAPSDARALQRLGHAGMATPVSSMIDGFDYRLKNEAGQSNPFLMTYAPAPVVLDNGDNDESTKAQPVSAPCVIAGQIEKQSDRDWYAFSAKKGQVFSIEAFGERTGAPMDLFFQVRTAQGAVITEQDDSAEVLSPQFYTSNRDPQKYRFVAASDATYHLMVTSREAFTQFGPSHLYTVRITAEQPDFRLIAMPTSPLNPEGTLVNQAGGAAFNVYIWRFGGFNDDITLTGQDLPAGLTVPTQIISGGQKQAVVVVQADASTKHWAGAIQIVGTATVKGQKLTRDVRSATMTWPVAQANIPSITRLDRELVVAVRDKAPYSLIVGIQKINVFQGEKISIPVKLLPGENFKTNVQVAALGGPTGLVPVPITLTPGQAGGTVSLDAKGGAAFAPGNYTIFLRGQTQPINPKAPPPKGVQPPNYIQVSMPVALTIVPKQLGKVSVTPTTTKVAPGKEIEVLVRVARSVDLPSSFKVEAIIPASVKGLSAKAVMIQKEEDEVKMIFTAEPTATLAAMQTITLRFTAMFNDTIPVVHETKLTLSITK